MWFLVIMLLLIVPFISQSSIVFSLQVVSLSEPIFIVFAPYLLSHSVRSRLPGHIRPQSQTYLVYPGHIRPEAGHIRPSSFNLFKLNEFQVWLPIHPPPHSRQLSTIGRCRGQASPSTSTPMCSGLVDLQAHREATSLRTVLSIVHLTTKNAREPRRTPESLKECHGSSVHPLRTDLLSLGSHWPCNYFQI
jgi:hypothetical protein